MSDLGPILPVNYGPDSIEIRQIVIHSVESGMTPGIMEALARGWWQNQSNRSSVHGGADPRDHVDMVPAPKRAWHCGTGNSSSWGEEHSGRAAFTKEEWLTPDAVKMLNNSARRTSKVAKQHGIPFKWLTVAEVRANVKGYCTHNDMRLARGGTTHTDPGPNFPYALYMQLVQQWSGAPVTPGPVPAPIPPGPGGAEQENEEDDMEFLTRVATDDPGQWWHCNTALRTKAEITETERVFLPNLMGSRLTVLNDMQDPKIIESFKNITPGN